MFKNSLHISVVISSRKSADSYKNIRTEEVLNPPPPAQVMVMVFLIDMIEIFHLKNCILRFLKDFWW